MTASFITAYGLQNYIEDKTERGCSEELGRLNRERLGIESEAHARLRGLLQTDIARVYPTIDLSFLSMQNTDVGIAYNYTKYNDPASVKSWIVGAPRFSTFSIDSSRFQITLATSCSVSDGRHFLHDLVADQYGKIEAKVTNRQPPPKKCCSSEDIEEKHFLLWKNNFSDLFLIQQKKE